MTVQQSPSKLLRIYSKCLCGATFFLIFAGGMVTSTGSGLAVPDWPLSYGTLFPPMVGGVFYEHGHRMIASGVGLLTLIFAVWLAQVESRRWVKVIGFVALGAVILQGILGGITVLFYLPTAISVSHATLAQTFLLITVFLAYSQSNERYQREIQREHHITVFRRLIVLFIALIYAQLLFGALMRHSGAGLAIPDFPTMGGEWWPAFDAHMLTVINNRLFDLNHDFVNLNQVYLHFFHRFNAIIILLAVCILTIMGIKYYRDNGLIIKTLLGLNILIGAQITLGILTVLSVKEPVTTSLHVVTGAGVLTVSFLLLLRASPLQWKHFIRESNE